MNFALNLIIVEAVGLANYFIANSHTKPALKEALQNLVVACQAVQAAVQSGQ